MNQTPIFIPILSIPGLMGVDNSKFHKKYSFLKLDKSEQFDTLGVIDKRFGRAIIEVVIRPEIKKTNLLKEKGERVEQIIVQALVDTGAQISSIRNNSVKQLKLRTFKGAWIAGLNKKPTQMRNVNLSVHLSLRNDGFLDICPIVGEFGDEPFDFIIGWDILKYCTLSYDGPSKQFDLKFTHPD